MTLYCNSTLVDVSRRAGIRWSYDRIPGSPGLESLA